MSPERIKTAKLIAFMEHREQVAKEACERYDAKADAARSTRERETWGRMASTERCAAFEVRYLIDVITGERPDRAWKASRLHNVGGRL